MKTLRLYSRPTCHLWERLEGEIAPLIEGRARLEVVNIDEGIEFKKRFGLRIPILTADKEELSGYPLEIAVPERYLARELDERVFGHVRV